MFGLQFWDEIAAFQKLPEFLQRIRSNYTVVPRLSGQRNQPWENNLQWGSQGQWICWFSLNVFIRVCTSLRRERDRGWLLTSKRPGWFLPQHLLICFMFHSLSPNDWFGSAHICAYTHIHSPWSRTARSPADWPSSWQCWVCSGMSPTQ